MRHRSSHQEYNPKITQSGRDGESSGGFRAAPCRGGDGQRQHSRSCGDTCYLPLVGTGASATERIRDSIADHDEIRGVIGEAAVQPVGSAPWWRMVRIVMAVSAEHLEHEERDVLPDCLPGLSMSRRKELGRQWCAFMAAWRPDATLTPARRSSSGPTT
jgi:hypothetical protein